MEAKYPRYPPLDKIKISAEEQSMWIDLAPYINTTPYTIQASASVARVFQMFRRLGLRHLVAVDRVNDVVGIITRKDLAHEFIEARFHRLFDPATYHSGRHRGFNASELAYSSSYEAPSQSPWVRNLDSHPREGGGPLSEEDEVKQEGAGPVALERADSVEVFGSGWATSGEPTVAEVTVPEPPCVAPKKPKPAPPPVKPRHVEHTGSTRAPRTWAGLDDEL
jgi:hypothetical protein